MDKKKVKNRVLKLREEGKTYLEIQRKIKTSIPKSTLSYWCHDIPLPLGYQRRIQDYNKFNLKKARKTALAVIKAKREKFLKDLWERNLYLLGKIDKDVQKIILSILYYCEGAKWKGHSGLQLGSSDPELIKFYLELLRKYYHIDQDKLRCRVNYRADQNINKLQAFWSKITKVPLNHFFKTKPDPRSIGKKTKKKDYKGVCTVSYGNTKIQLELETIARLLFKGP